MTEPMPMLLDDADRALLSERLLERFKSRSWMIITDDDLRAEIRAVAEDLVAEGGFVFQEGVFIRWPPLMGECEEFGCHEQETDQP